MKIEEKTFSSPKSFREMKEFSICPIPNHPKKNHFTLHYISVHTTKLIRKFPIKKKVKLNGHEKEEVTSENQLLDQQAVDNDNINSVHWVKQFFPIFRHPINVGIKTNYLFIDTEKKTENHKKIRKFYVFFCQHD